MQFGFSSWQDIERYLGVQTDSDEDNANNNEKTNLYDYILIDIDDNKKISGFDMFNADKNYFVTSFDMFSLNKGIRVFQDLERALKLTKVLFSYDSVTKDEEEYLDSLSIEYSVTWNEYALYFHILNEDNKVIQENQRLEKIRFKRLTSNLKESLTYLIQDITGIENFARIRKLMKD